MAIVILVAWVTLAGSLIWVWRQLVSRQQRPVTYWFGIALSVLSPQLYFLAYGVVDWVRFRERCDMLEVSNPETVSTPLVWIENMGPRGRELYGGLRQYLSLGLDFQPGDVGWVRNLKDSCTLEMATRQRMACYESQEVVVDALPEYGIAASWETVKGGTTQWYSMFHVTYKLLKHDQVVGMWEEYTLSRSGINFLLGPNQLICTSAGLSLREWVKSSVGTGN